MQSAGTSIQGRFGGTMKNILWVFFIVLSFSRDLLSEGGNPTSCRPVNSSWGFAAGIVQSYGEISISKNLTKNWMLLFSAGIGLSSEISKDRTDYLSSTNTSDIFNTNRKNFSISVGPELRKYQYQKSDIAFYMGINPFIKYDYEKNESEDTQIDSQNHSQKTNRPYKRWQTSIGVNFTLGVEYFVLDHLGLSVHLNPLTYSYSKYDLDQTNNQEGDLVAQSSRKSTNHNFRFYQNSGLFVRIYF
jgi:hypothetical protein